MADVRAEREGLMDGMPRDTRGYWQPEGIKLPNPVFDWPPKPMAVAKWAFNYLFPWNFVYMLIAVLTVVYLQPEMSRMTRFSADWILYLFVRNQVMLIVIVSAWHLWLWARKSQGFQFKYTADWMAKGKRQFLAGNQLFDNIFWSCVSGGTIWTAYEVVTLWAYANEYIPYLDPRAHPVYFVLMLCAIQLWRLFHFYWVHRLLHWPPLYKAGHFLHHRNINVGPWSGPVDAPDRAHPLLQRCADSLDHSLAPDPRRYERAARRAHAGAGARGIRGAGHQRRAQTGRGILLPPVASSLLRVQLR